MNPRHEAEERSQIALVTGAGSGIGRDLALALARRGHVVWACGRRPQPLAQLAGECGAIRPFPADVTRAADRESLAEAIRAEHASLDLLVNNAGVQRHVDFAAGVDAHDIEEEIAVNLTAPILLTALLLEPLRRAPRPRVVNISSGLALAPKASAPVYCAAKAGLSNFSLALGFQLEPLGIRVVDVITPLVRTPMTAGRADGAMEPAEFAAAVVAALERAPDRLYVGKTRLLALLSRLAPRRARRILRHA